MVHCVKCGKDFEDSDSIMVCSRCGAMYHKNCWFSTPTCITPGCNNDRGMPLRGENLDPDMDQDYVKDMLAESNTKAYFYKKLMPIIIVGLIFVLWIVVNSYNDYLKNHKETNTITFTEKD